MNYLLDTCILSETIKPTPDARVVAWLSEQNEEELFISTISVGELRKGIERLPAGSKKHHLLIWLSRLLEMYSTRFLDFDPECAMSWGSLCAEAKQEGHPLPVLDSMLAATALRFGCTLVTRNTRDYEGTPARVLNPWTEISGSSPRDS